MKFIDYCRIQKENIITHHNSGYKGYANELYLKLLDSFEKEVFLSIDDKERANDILREVHSYLLSQPSA